MMEHGSALKYCHPSDNLVKNADYYTAICYTADLFKESVKFWYDADDAQMYLNGYPRCDYMFNTNLDMNNSKSVIWLPTYRNGLGINYKGKMIPIIDSENIVELNLFLKDRDIALYIKPHILEEMDLKKILSANKCSNIFVLSEADLISNNVPFYQFLVIY